MRNIFIFNHVGIIGGSGISLLQIVEAIDKKEYIVTVVTVSSPKDLVEYLKSKNVCKVIELKTNVLSYYYSNGSRPFLLSPVSIKNIYKIISNKKEIESIINYNDIDIIMVNSMTMFYIGKIAKKYNIKTICWQRETFPNSIFSVRKLYMKYIMAKYFDVITFISNFDMRGFEKYNVKTMLIYDKIDISAFDKMRENKSEVKSLFSLNKEKKYILFLGGINKIKGTHVALKALSLISERNVVLIIVGYEKMYDVKTLSSCKGIKSKLRHIMHLDYEAYCLKYIKTHNLGDKVLFYPLVTDVEKYYNIADVLIFPSTEAHQSRPLYEAAIAKIPTVISNYPNTKEFILESTYEFIPKNELDLAEKIVMALSSKNDDFQKEYDLVKKNHDINSLKQDLKKLLDIANNNLMYRL